MDSVQINRVAAILVSDLKASPLFFVAFLVVFFQSKTQSTEIGKEKEGGFMLSEIFHVKANSILSLTPINLFFSRYYVIVTS